MDLSEEKELIKLAQRDPVHFARVYSAYYPKIFGYALKRTAKPEIAQDITSETFFKALKKLWQFRWRNISFSAWLYKIATNEVNQYFRKGTYKSASLDDLHRLGLEPVSLDNPEAELIKVQEELARHQEFLFCQETISRLDVKYQEVITLRFFEQKQIQEIGEILGKPEGTVKSLLHRGLEQLRGTMAEEAQTQPSAGLRIVDSDRSLKLTDEQLQNDE